MSDLRTRLHLQPDGRLVAETVQDVQPILDRNKALQGQASVKNIIRNRISLPLR